METHGKNHGNPWKPMETHGNPWKPMEKPIEKKPMETPSSSPRCQEKGRYPGDAMGQAAVGGVRPLIQGGWSMDSWGLHGLVM